MSEVKIEFPVYVRVGLCKECGAAVYAPETSTETGEFKRMSACSCVQSPTAFASRAAGTATPGQGVWAEGKEAA